MEHIHKDVCKYFSVLHEVLCNRPNMWAAYTNEDEEHLDSNVGNGYSNPIEFGEDTSEEDESSCAKGNTANSSVGDLDISDLTASDMTVSTTMSGTKSKRTRGNCTKPTPESPTKKNRLLKDESMSESKKISFTEGSKLRRNMRKSITESKLDGSLTDSILDDTKNMKEIMRVHGDKMKRRERMHEETLQIQSSRLNLELSRGRREEELQKLQMKKLKADTMKVISEHNYDMLQKRNELKRSDPNLTDAYLDQILPFMSTETD